MTTQLIILFILIAISGFFSASEIAIFSLSDAKIKILVNQKKRYARRLTKLKANPSRLLTNILIGNNLVNISASSMAAVLAFQIFGSIGPAIAIGVLTVLVLIFGEIGPKSYASSRPEKFALAATPILIVVDIILRPVAVIFEFINTIFMKFFTHGIKAPTVLEDELRALAEIGVAEGVMENQEKEMIKRILEFNDIDAGDVMAVRSEIFSLPSLTTVEKAIPRIIESHHSRIPIYQGDIDGINGIIYLPDLLQAVSKGDVDVPLSKIARKPYFIPKQRKIDDIFKDFQRQHNHIAIVVDEHGITLGIVTLEDLLEEIVGEIMDESDVDEFLIKRLDRYSILVDAGTEAREVSQYFNVEIPGDQHRFISEIFLSEFGRIPKAGDEVDFDTFKMVVEKATAKKIEKVRIIKPKPKK